MGDWLGEESSEALGRFGGRMKIRQTPASTVNSVPFLHSRKFYAFIIDACRSLHTADSA